MKGLVEDFAGKCKCIREAQRLRRATVGTGKDKMRTYLRLTELADKMDVLIEELEATRPLWSDEIRKQKRRDRLPIIISLIGIAVSVLVAVFL